ncbi:MAG: Sua5/YciO/YrdC/YwlC family protein [Bacteroidetes bacterium]|nr:Sua5/YciO/YrdC/YwlC family protein [Bacteroidota bacterium]
MKEIEILNNGGIILYPTDTIWGLGCDATQPLAIKKIIELKGRDESKNLLILVKDIEMLLNYVENIPKEALGLIENTPTPLTIIYPKAKNLPIEYLSQSQSIGIRIPKHSYCQALLSKFGKPIVSTSANISGEPSPIDFYSISQKIKNGVDYISEIEKDKISNNLGSSIVLIKDTGEIIKIR